MKMMDLLNTIPCGQMIKVKYFNHGQDIEEVGDSNYFKTNGDWFMRPVLYLYAVGGVICVRVGDPE